MNASSRLLLTILLGVLTLATAVPADAQDVAGDDEAALAAYTLTMERVEGWHHAAQSLQHLDENPPLTEDWGGGILQEIVQWIERTPSARRAVEEAGLSPRDFALTNMALYQAIYVYAEMTMGHLTAPSEGVNPANIAFVRTHQAEIREMLSDLE